MIEIEKDFLMMESGIDPDSYVSDMDNNSFFVPPCCDCKWFTPFDGFCKSPSTTTKHVPEYILFAGCGWFNDSV